MRTHPSLSTLTALLATLGVACTHDDRPFALRDVMVRDTDLTPVSVPCRPEPTKEDPNAQNCAPEEYVSPFVWDQVDNLVFARIARGLRVATHGESRNVNSMDEVPDSSWFTNKPITGPGSAAPGSCETADLLPGPDEVGSGAWVIDHGKDNGSTPGFRVVVPGKGKYMLKADDTGKPERSSAASVIGAAIYDAIGFNATCEQVVLIRKAQLTLTPNLTRIDNSGATTPFDADALDTVLKNTTQVAGGLQRFQASKWLGGATIGPFRYVGTRADDPNDVVPHEDRRDLRGSRLLAAWIDHWDAREQNSMDVWYASDAKHKKSSPGFVKHYILDTSDILGQEVGSYDLSRRLGHTYELDFADIGIALITLGAVEEPWDRAARTPGREQFGYFHVDDFSADEWRPFYPNPAHMRATERDNAWMARKIAALSPEDVHGYIMLGQWSDAAAAEYVYGVLMQRQRVILGRFLTRLSPLGDVAQDGKRICATDFARLREVDPVATYHYDVVQSHAGQAAMLATTVDEHSRVCFEPQPTGAGGSEHDDQRRVDFTIRNGSSASPIVLHAFDLGPAGFKLIGLTR